MNLTKYNYKRQAIFAMGIAVKNSPHFPFDNSYARLPERFYARLDPTPVTAPGLIKINTALAHRLGLDPDTLASPQGIDIFAGNQLAEGSEPLAMAYAGQQFGGWVPQLGDGRAHLLGEVIDDEGVRRDIALKGSGRTPYSRGGDGRAGIGPVLREYVLSEAMAALNIPTTRALAAITTGEDVFREQTVPGAVLTRVAASHIRVGTFQYFAGREDAEAVQALADYVIERHYPQAREAENPYLSLLENVIARQATLIARWMAVGFIHGVMNTDNMLICGETIDYGPCAFMDAYDPETVFSSIDHGGRYAYQNQPRIAQWNLASFASSILPLIDDVEDTAVATAENALAGFVDLYDAAWTVALRAKIGLSEDLPGDRDLGQDLLDRMAANTADFTLTFRRLSDLGGDVTEADAAVADLFDTPAAFHEWAILWRTRLARETADDATRQAAMKAVNPAYIPRNHRVEQVIQAALVGNFTPFETLLEVLSTPFDEQPEHADYQNPPQPDEVVHETFCGT